MLKEFNVPDYILDSTPDIVVKRHILIYDFQKSYQKLVL